MRDKRSGFERLSHWAKAACVLLFAAGCESTSDIGTCSTGSLGCAEVVAELDARACAALGACLAKRSVADTEIVAVESCDETVRIPALAGLPILELAAMQVALDTDGPPTHAALLWARTAKGWAPSELLLEPSWTHGGWCEARFMHDWQPESGASARLRIQAERLCHMPLDAEELEAGESDVAFQECRTTELGIGPHGLRVQSVSNLEGTCRNRPDVSEGPAL